VTSRGPGLVRSRALAGTNGHEPVITAACAGHGRMAGIGGGRSSLLRHGGMRRERRRPRRARRAAPGRGRPDAWRGLSRSTGIPLLINEAEQLDPLGAGTTVAELAGAACSVALMSRKDTI
jgi:hypothetical protein